ncbi:MAG: putative selenate reductase subunit YgfK [Hydrogenoanaerobacterium sp.]
MSDRMTPIPFDKLMNHILAEHGASGEIFGVHRCYTAEKGKTLKLFGEQMETPFGPAAGPHTQLSQNIIAAYFAGSRFFELKTVQTLDGEDLPVAKPCINAEDECYNVEWSTELRVPEAYDEYVKAWFALKLLAKELSLGDADGFMFNMSVGYDLEGIKSKKIDTFIEGLKDASQSKIWQECNAWALANLSRFKKVDAAFVGAISPKVCTSITLSTLHGCPPQEIERIATYLITEKGLNTYIKCNPTLLGYEFARKTMDDMGYDYLVFDDHHFNDDLHFEDAVPMIERLLALSAERGLTFGVKLTNTFPVGIGRGELPGEEMYMSGRSLYPLTLEVANRLTKAFKGKLRISYSGGADIFNIENIFACGIWPITLATTLLKPGGYQRLSQMAEALAAHEYKQFDGINEASVEALAHSALTDRHNIKAIKPLPSRKISKKVPLTDCFTAPCQDGCPIGQDIPAYIRLAGEGKSLEALRVITDKNPLPFITGTICPHHCADKCTRSFYDESVKIRAAKLEAANKGYSQLMAELKPINHKGSKTAIIGGGPAGLAAAYFLGKAGVPVTVFEKKQKLGGIVSLVIPEFRIASDAIEKDVALVRAMGGEFIMGSEQCSVEQLKARGYKYILFAVGAWKHGALKLESGKAINVLEFLEQYKLGEAKLSLGKNVVIVGGGNTAMDAARAAKRVKGVEKVSLVYRRTKRYMPADEEELQLAIDDGVEFRELLSPIELKDGVLRCYKMTLGAPDASGRRSPVQTEEIEDVAADTVIAAVGEKVDTELFTQNGIAVDERGRVTVNEKTMETSVKGVFVAGDARRGAATVVEAIADATQFAQTVAKLETGCYSELNISPTPASAMMKKGLLEAEPNQHKQCDRCLECATVCECCVDVCPNRANLAIDVGTSDMPQIIHVDAMCNECGNCTIFCPYDSSPYKEKFTLFANEKDFADSTNEGFMCVDGEKSLFKVRLDGQIADYVVSEPKCGLPANICKLIATVYVEYNYLF